jgi:FdhD protein
MEIRIGNKALVTTMRTPGNDEELAAGFLVAEGIVRTRSDIREIAPCRIGPNKHNALKVTLGPDARVQSGLHERYGAISASCGVCGKTSIDAITSNFPAIEGDLRVPASVILACPQRLLDAQKNFEQTGGLHAAALFDGGGRLLHLREDIGRHNAVDKVNGRAFLDNVLPLNRHVLMVSGRTSFEILQKALAGGIAIVVAVSAPSSLAVAFARENGQTLVGFLRPPLMNIYSHPDRILLEE